MPALEKESGTTVLRRTAEYQPPHSWRTWLIGRPLRTADAPHQAIGKAIGLAVFASDALSSTAYATDEILFVLAAAGAAAFVYALPISLAIVAWIVILLVPILVAMFSAIHYHYRDLAARLSLEQYGGPPRISRQRVILAISGIHRGTLAALRYARTLSDGITAVHICTDPVEAETLNRKWESWGDGIRLVVLDSPYRLLLEPLC